MAIIETTAIKVLSASYLVQDKLPMKTAGEDSVWKLANGQIGEARSTLAAAVGFATVLITLITFWKSKGSWVATGSVAALGGLLTFFVGGGFEWLGGIFNNTLSQEAAMPALPLITGSV